MQGYATSEPFAIEKAAGFKPGVLLLADYGFNAYSTMIETRSELIDKKPGSGSAFRRCLDRRLVPLSVRR